MKRFLHALAALWPKNKEVGSPPAPPTSTGLRQHLAAVIRMERHVSECTDLHSRKRHAVTSDTHPARREVERPGSTVNRPERSDIPHPSRKAGSETVGTDDSSVRRINEYTTNLLDDSPDQQFVDRNAVRSRQGNRSGSSNQPQSIPRIPQPMPLLTILMLVFFMCLMAAPSRAIGTAAFLDSIPESAIRPLQIGDTIPEELWTMPMVLWTSFALPDTIKLNQFNGKWLLLDFWNTYCGSCIDAFPRMNALQEDYALSLKILNVTKETPERLDVVKERPKMKGTLTQTLIGDAVLHMVFPHGTVPHLVLISPGGRVSAFPESRGFTADYIGSWIETGGEPDTRKEVGDAGIF